MENDNTYTSGDWEKYRDSEIVRELVRTGRLTRNLWRARERGLRGPKAPEKPMPCRLFFLLARSAPVGVIFRRGPSSWVQMIRWDTSNDTFLPGQWLHGLVYVGRCDLTPSGEKLVYFCAQHSRHKYDEQYTYAWTAISRPPYFTALALWPKGDCWHGGGLFPSESELWLNHKPEVAQPHPDHLPMGLSVEPNPQAYGEDWPVLERRLAREGWQCKRSVEVRLKRKGWHTDVSGLYIKAEPRHGLILHWEEIYDGQEGFMGRHHRYSVISKGGETILEAGNAEWADWDQSGRLVLVREGKLLCWDASKDDRFRELADFSDFKPTNVPPPPEALVW